MSEIAIYTLLLASADVSALAGTRIFNRRAPQKPQSPFLIFYRVDDVPWRSIDGASGVTQHRITIDAYSTDAAEAMALARAARLAVNDYSGVVSTGIGDVRVGAVSRLSGRSDEDTSVDPPWQVEGADYLVTSDE